MSSPSSLQVNEELLADTEFFSSDERKQVLRSMFNLDRRRVLFGHGALASLGSECEQLGVHSVLLVRERAIAEVAAPVEAALVEAGVTVTGVFADIVPNPTVASVDALAAFVAASEADAVIAVGGGSTMDTCKVGLAVATCGGSAIDYFGFDQFPQVARWPLICLPTTAGTGAEVSQVSVIVAEGGKQAVYSDHIQPRIAIVDPALSANMPAGLTATTGLDALGHALECTASTKSNEIGDAVARESLRAGMPHMIRAIESGAADAEARYQMCRCSLLAGLLLSPINTGAAHALGYGIEKVSFEKGNPVPHGTAVALVLPGVMEHNAPAVADKYYFAAGVAGLDIAGSSREQGVRAVAGWIEDLRRSFTPYATLADAGLTEADLPRMVEIGIQVRRLLEPNPVEVTEDDAVHIYRAVLA
ncbi:MAG: iron-containing alcohol dehydrogenase [Candidatus Latescibacterota bacterium]|nr:iron-containing alcohol dehydrogenase [Candidatus Latescibacterota bacterium]